MKIADAGELRTFETMPTETTLYLAVVRFDAGSWSVGPCGHSKDEVARMLATLWKHAIEARIYSVRLPIILHCQEGRE